MVMLARKVLLTRAIEATYGSGATFIAADSALVAEPKLTPLNSEVAERKIIRPYFGNAGNVPVAASGELEYMIELVGAGTAGAIPGYGVDLRSCGFAEVQTVGTDVLYSLVTSGMESFSTGFNLDGVQHNFNGARSDLTIDIPAKDIPMLKFKTTGLYVPPTDMPPLTPDYSKFQVPYAANTTNTPVLTLDGRPLVASNISISLGNEVKFVVLIGLEVVVILDRKVKGTVTYANNSIAEKDWYALALSGNPVPFSVTHGSVPGKQVTISGPAVQVGAPQQSEQDGIAMLQSELSFMPVNGNDELTIKVH